MRSVWPPPNLARHLDAVVARQRMEQVDVAQEAAGDARQGIAGLHHIGEGLAAKTRPGSSVICRVRLCASLLPGVQAEGALQFGGGLLLVAGFQQIHRIQGELGGGGPPGWGSRSGAAAGLGVASGALAAVAGALAGAAGAPAGGCWAQAVSNSASTPGRAWRKKGVFKGICGAWTLRRIPYCALAGPRTSINSTMPARNAADRSVSSTGMACSLGTSSRLTP